MKKVWKALDTLKDVDTGVSGSDALNIIEQALTKLEQQSKELAKYKNIHIGIDCSDKDINAITIMQEREDAIYVIYSKTKFKELYIDLDKVVGEDDVKRFMELDYQAKVVDFLDNAEENEYTRLHRKLNK